MHIRDRKRNIYRFSPILSQCSKLISVRGLTDSYRNKTARNYPVKNTMTGRLFITGLIPLLILSSLTLSGCQGDSPDTTTGTIGERHDVAVAAKVQPLTPDEKQKTPPADGPVEQCQRELIALSKINPAMYQIRQATFSGLLKNASIYSSVRHDINSQTKDTIDALYKYKTQKICHDIEQDIQQSLINHGETLK